MGQIVSTESVGDQMTRDIRDGHRWRDCERNIAEAVQVLNEVSIKVDALMIENRALRADKDKLKLELVETESKLKRQRKFELRTELDRL